MLIDALQNENSRVTCIIAVFCCCSEKSVMESVVDFISDVVPQVSYIGIKKKSHNNLILFISASRNNHHTINYIYIIYVIISTKLISFKTCLPFSVEIPF